MPSGPARLSCASMHDDTRKLTMLLVTTPSCRVHAERISHCTRSPLHEGNLLEQVVGMQLRQLSRVSLLNCIIQSLSVHDAYMWSAPHRHLYFHWRT